MKTKNSFVKILFLAVLSLSVIFTACSTSSTSNAATADVQNVTVTILETSDMHGSIAPWDYATDSAYDGGFAQVATIIKQQRDLDKDLILLDCGDSMQDNLIQEFRHDSVHPMVKVFNKLKYDAWQLGNHEFNFEFDVLKKEIKASKMPVLGANIYKKDGKRFATPYIIKDVKGVKVAVIGLAAPHEDRWEASNPEHFDNMTFTTPMEELEKILPEVKSKADIIVVLAHYGKDGEYDTPGMSKVAEKYGDQIDAFLIGHAHDLFATKLSNGAVMTEPGTKGAAISKVTIEMAKENGVWKKQNANAELIQVKGQKIEPDAEILSLTKDIDTKSRKISNTVVGKIGADFLPSLWWRDLPTIPTAVIQDTAMMDLINKVQMEETHADVSLAALFDPTSNLTKGDFKKKDGIKIYKYDNTLMAVKVTGAQLKKVMENQAGAFFNAPEKGDVTISFNKNIRLYNYDMFAGVDYEIDISKPVGKRITNVMYKGQPLKDDEQLVLALNNYRYGGLSTSGFISSDSDDLVYNTGKAIRDLISDYVSSKGTLMPECDNNWKITGFDYDVPGAEEIYKKVRSGEITIPTSEDGRTTNVKSLNVNNF